MVKVSIITPAYNCTKSFKGTYESVLFQTFFDWEWIIVEDCSTDGTFDIIKKLIGNDKRVKIFKTEKNSGAAVARNLGIEKASGQYIAFLDADDLWEPNKLERQIKFMDENDFAISYSKYKILYENGKTKTFSPKKTTIKYKQLLWKTDIGCLTGMYDSNKLGKRYMPVDCIKREDHGFWLDLTRDGTVAHLYPEYLATYRVASSSVSSKKTKMIKYEYLLYRNHEHFSIVKSLWFLMLRIFNKLFAKYN